MTQIKKLYRATFEIEAIVAAENVDEAFDVARDFANEIVTEEAPYPNIAEIDPNKAILPPSWNKDCIPYGADNDDTIAAWQSTDEDKQVQDDG